MRRIAPLFAGAIAAIATTQAAAQTQNPTAPTQAPSAATAQPPAATSQPRAPAVDPEAQRELDAILGRWEQTSGKIETLYAAFEQVDEQAIMGVKDYYRGSAYLSRPNRVVLQLEKKSGEGDQVQYSFVNRIIATGEEVVDFDGEARQVTIYPMPEDARERALEEGPLPFLFRMNVEAFKARYAATLMDSQPGTHRIAVYPRHPVDRDAFSVAVLILDAKTLQPRSIHTLASNGKDKQNYYIKDFRGNVSIPPELFNWSDQKAQDAQKDGWRIVENPAPDQVGMQPESQTELAPLPR